MKNIYPCFLVLSLVACPLFADEPAPVKADFAESIPDGWSAAKGEWKVVDGALQGSELESDEHAAVFSIPDPHQNSSLSFRFLLD